MLEFKRRCYLGLGSNKGDRKENIKKALVALGQTEGIELIRHSSIYLTEPVGVTSQPDFYNCVAEVDTTLAPLALLQAIKKIEFDLGREPNTHWLPRTIDIDILLYGDLEIDSLELMIPHSRLTRRAFVLIPLLELDPEMIHPVSRRPLSEYLVNLKEKQQVEKVIDAGGLF